MNTFAAASICWPTSLGPHVVKGSSISATVCRPVQGRNYEPMTVILAGHPVLQFVNDRLGLEQDYDLRLHCMLSTDGDQVQQSTLYFGREKCPFVNIRSESSYTT